MASITILEKAPILDDGGVHIGTEGHSVVSSDPAVATAEYQSGYLWWVVAQATGTTTLTATRLAGGATADLEVEVVSAAPFAITLGPAVPR